MSRPPLPPFTLETAVQKVRLAEDAAGGQWFRSCGNENWAFDGEGLMHTRIASINDFAIAIAIADADRLFRWPSGRRTDDHAGIAELGL